jgi:hypothetical protein
MTDALTVAQTALTAMDRLARTTEKSSLDDLVAAKTKRSLIAADVSSSMEDGCADGKRKIDNLRVVLEQLQTTHPVPVCVFGLHGGQIELVERIPEPQGMTPLHKAIDFARVQEANHLVVLTDGVPDSRTAAFEAAARFGHPIDVFFIGNEGGRGADFCRELAKCTGGQFGITDLAGTAHQKQLTSAIAGLLGSGTETL